MIGSEFNIIDMSGIKREEPVVVTDTSPIYLACGPTAKGTEKMGIYSATNFKTMFGDPDFKKYGQGSVQNQRVIDAGGRILFKRVVAHDAALANITICSDIKVIPKQMLMYNADGSAAFEMTTKEVDVYETITDYTFNKFDTRTTTTIGTTDITFTEASTDDDIIAELKRVILVEIGKVSSDTSAYVINIAKVEGESGVYAILTKKNTGRKETVEVPVYEEIAGYSIKVQKKHWAPTAEVSYIALSDPKQIKLSDNFSKDTLSNIYKNTVGAVPVGDESAMVDADHTLLIPTEQNTKDLFKDDTIENVWGYALDKPVNGSYNGYWIVDNKWIQTDAKGYKSIKIPADATKTPEEVHKMIEVHYRYPLFTVADIGRGVSKKSFRIYPENTISKNLNFMYYTLEIIEDGEIIDIARFSMLPDVIYNGDCIDLEMASRKSLKYSQVASYEDNMLAYIDRLAAEIGEDPDLLKMHDFIFCTLRKGTKIANVDLGEGYSVNLKTGSGIQLENGDNGSFTDAPMLNAKDLVAEKILTFFSCNRNATYLGQSIKLSDDKNYTYDYEKRLLDIDYDLDLYNTDLYQIDAVFDCCYSVPTKGAIGFLANYRSDFHYFRDHGVECRTLTDAQNMVSGQWYDRVISDYECEYYPLGKQEQDDHKLAAALWPLDPVLAPFHKDLNNDGVITENKLVSYGDAFGFNIIHSKWISDWVEAWNVINPYDMKEITVSQTYNLAYQMVKHIENNIEKAFCGYRNNAIMDGILEGTINFIPKKTPFYNEKEELEDVRCNFGNYFKNDFVIESCWTSQDDYTQMSFINNTMALQKVIKALRVKFPAERYQFVTSMNDIIVYTNTINEFLGQFSYMFAELKFEYVTDTVALQNKVYRGALYFRFGITLQAERIDAYLLPTEIVG